VRSADCRPTVTSPVPRAVWESLVRSDPGVVVTQSLAWRDAVFADGRYQDVSLLYEFPSGRSVVLPMARHRRRPRWADAATSWPDIWGVGGPISQGGRIDQAEAAAVLIDVAQRRTLSAQIHLRYGADPAWLNGASPFRVIENRGWHVIDIAGGFSHVWNHSFRATARTAVRKAERSGLDIEVDRSGRLLPVFCDLYQKSVQRWAVMQHQPVWFTRWRTTPMATPRMLESVARCLGEDCSVWVARSKGVPVAAIIVVRFGSYAHYWRGAMDKELATPVRANDLLHRRAIEEACGDGYRFYSMGNSQPGSPLAQFKEKLGATQHFTHILRVERLPIRRTQRMSRDIVKRIMGSPNRSDPWSGSQEALELSRRDAQGAWHDSDCSPGV
jgi:Acetyltransferase (GNAT) domain